MIKVTYKVYTTAYSIFKTLEELKGQTVMSLDFETQSKASLEERAEAREFLKTDTEMSAEDKRLCKMVAKSTGLSYPSMVKVTHVIFGVTESHSIILVIYDSSVEYLIMHWIVNFKGKLLIHNALFDLKLVYERTKQFPVDFEDTQLFAKTLMNHVNVWKANTGLKHLMASFYDPKWTLLVETYDVVDYTDESFLKYCAIDGAATVKLWNQLKEAT